jgi:hypothetical protein
MGVELCFVDDSYGSFLKGEHPFDFFFAGVAPSNDSISQMWHDNRMI